MKRLVKRPLKALWRWTSAFRRPITARVERLVARAAASQTHLCLVTEDTNLLMDHLLREVVRLGDRVDRLQQAVEDLSLAPAAGGLSVIGHDADSAAG